MSRFRSRQIAARSSPAKRCARCQGRHCKCYGGDITATETSGKQKEGKKKMRQFGKVESAGAFIAALK